MNHLSSVECRATCIVKKWALCNKSRVLILTLLCSTYCHMELGMVVTQPKMKANILHFVYMYWNIKLSNERHRKKYWQCWKLRWKACCWKFWIWSFTPEDLQSGLSHTDIKIYWSIWPLHWKAYSCTWPFTSLAPLEAFLAPKKVTLDYLPPPSSYFLFTGQSYCLITWFL